MSNKAYDILMRALKTFWQAALASLALSMPTVIETLPNGWDVAAPLLSYALVGAVAAGFSALYNGVIKPLFELPARKKEEAAANEDTKEDESEDNEEEW